MKAVIAVAALTVGANAQFESGALFGVSTSKMGANPPPYEVYNIAIENASPDASLTRRLAEERRSETLALQGVAETRSRSEHVVDSLSAIDALHARRTAFLKTQGIAGGSPLDFPVVEAGLASPTNPYPSVANRIASLEKSRESMEAAELSALTSAYAAILAKSKAEISRAMGSSFLGSKASFLRVNPMEPSVEFNLVPSHSDVSAAGPAIDAMEAKRAAAEKAMLDSAVAELGEFAKVVVSEITRNASSRKSFLAKRAVPGQAEGFHRQLNIKLIPADNYMSVSNMVTSMERRRDASESAMRAAILDLEMSLAKSLNAFAGAALRI
jgi:hypothetical protein